MRGGRTQPRTGVRAAVASTVVALAGLAMLSVVTVAGAAASSHPMQTGPVLGFGNAGPASVAIRPGSQSTEATSFVTSSIGDAPSAICALGSTNCAAGVGVARVTLSASPSGLPGRPWPNVEIAFVVETSLYDGVFDAHSAASDVGGDSCSHAVATGHAACEESNGVPFFVAHASQIAEAIQASNPNSQVSFALIDYFGTGQSPWDDGDTPLYHVDVARFLPAAQFGSAVSASFQVTVLGGGFVYPDSDFADNFLDSSSITTLYGALSGGLLGWSSTAHHVVVWMGSTAPDASAYQENYCTSAHLFAGDYSGSACYSSPCEPSATFPTGASPQCEGWSISQDGDPTHSIAALAHDAPACTQSAGASCTVDVIELPTTTTDPNSPGWSTAPSSSDERAAILLNVAHVIGAGCDIATATDGTWSGPVGAACPGAGLGSLQYLPHGPYDRPNLENPALFDALRTIGFGPPPPPPTLDGGAQAMFTFVPFGTVALAPLLQASATCLHQGAPLPTCQRSPTVRTLSGVQVLGWNFSTSPATNFMSAGDAWTASFDVVAGAPYTTVPLDACVQAACFAAGSGAVNGLFSAAHFVFQSNGTRADVSFPVAMLTVEALVSGAPPPSSSSPASPAGPAPPPFAAPNAPPPVPAFQPAGAQPTPNALTIANLSIPALAAGLLAAGFSRILIQRQRAVALALRTPSGRRAASSGESTGPTSGRRR